MGSNNRASASILFCLCYQFTYIPFFCLCSFDSVWESEEWLKAHAKPVGHTGVGSAVARAQEAAEAENNPDEEGEAVGGEDDHDAMEE